jgi:hypothetical protein
MPVPLHVVPAPQEPPPEQAMQQVPLDVQTTGAVHEPLPSHSIVHVGVVHLTGARQAFDPHSIVQAPPPPQVVGAMHDPGAVQSTTQKRDGGHVAAVGPAAAPGIVQMPPSYMPLFAAQRAASGPASPGGPPSMGGGGGPPSFGGGGGPPSFGGGPDSEPSSARESAASAWPSSVTPSGAPDSATRISSTGTSVAVSCAASAATVASLPAASPGTCGPVPSEPSPHATNVGTTRMVVRASARSAARPAPESRVPGWTGSGMSRE